MPHVRHEGQRAEWGGLSVCLSASLCDLYVLLALKKSYTPIQLEQMNLKWMSGELPEPMNDAAQDRIICKQGCPVRQVRC